jgi:Zn-dependent protease
VLHQLRYPVYLLGVTLALLVGIVVHCVVQAAVARALGDRQPAAAGRLSPDPRRHFEPFGVIVMLLAGIGWNKPVPFQEPRFRGGRGRYVTAVLSGPLANLVLAVLGLVGMKLAGFGFVATVNPGVTGGGLGFADVLLFEFAVVNAALGVLTLIPIPPLDGARLLWLFAPKTSGWRNARYQLEERNFGLGICVLLLLPIFGNGVGLLMSVVLSVTGAFLAPIASALGMPPGF